MERIAVFIDDADHARHMLQPMIAGTPPAHWTLVACAPCLTRHASRWLTEDARRQWRRRWSDELFEQLRPLFDARGARVETMLARRPLTTVAQRLAARHTGLRLVDARLRRTGQALEPIVAGQPAGTPTAWAGHAAAAGGMGALLALAD